MVFRRGENGNKFMEKPDGMGWGHRPKAVSMRLTILRKSRMFSELPNSIRPGLPPREHTCPPLMSRLVDCLCRCDVMAAVQFLLSVRGISIRQFTALTPWYVSTHYSHWVNDQNIGHTNYQEMSLPKLKKGN
jgi:hypothetical protein